MNKKLFSALLITVAFLLSGCHLRYTAPEVVPIGLLESYKQDNAEIPAKVQVVNFVVNTVEANYSDDDKDKFRGYNAHGIPKRIYELLGASRAFTEVKRTASPNTEIADYIVSGTYDYLEDRTNAPFYHSIRVKGTMHVRVVRAKDNLQILDKDYVEDRSDSASAYQPIRVQYLQEAYYMPIVAEIKKCIAQDVSALRSKVPGATTK